jgi:hypothetical protein
MIKIISKERFDGMLAKSRFEVDPEDGLVLAFSGQEGVIRRTCRVTKQMTDASPVFFFHDGVYYESSPMTQWEIMAFNRNLLPVLAV